MGGESEEEQRQFPVVFSRISMILLAGSGILIMILVRSTYQYFSRSEEEDEPRPLLLPLGPSLVERMRRSWRRRAR